MLQGKLNECRVLISEVSENKHIDQENQKTARRNNTFFDSYNKYLVPTIKSYAVCKKYNHVKFSDTVLGDIQNCIDYSKKTFEQKTVIDPAKYQYSVKKLSERIESEWVQQTNNYLSCVREELGILRLVSNDKQEIQKILNCMNNFLKWPVDEERIAQYEIAKARAEEILSQMEFDDEIAIFLKKVKNKEATLLDLTDSIIAWIRREKLSGNIVLSIKN